MKTIEIREPIWKNRSVGLAERELTDNDIEVKITYKNKNGSLLYPNPFLIRKSIIERFPVMNRKGVKLFLVPISSMFEVKVGSFE